MGELIMLLLIVYVASWIFYWCEDYRRYQPLAKADIAELEQMIKDYREEYQRGTSLF